MSLSKQAKSVKWIGAIQIQFSNTSLYLSAYSALALSLTLWSTTIIGIGWRPEWLTVQIFLGIVIVVLIIVMYLDYKFIFPSRVAFANEQACKHENPAMESLLRVEATLKEQAVEIKAIRKKLGIKRVKKNA